MPKGRGHLDVVLDEGQEHSIGTSHLLNPVYQQTLLKEQQKEQYAHEDATAVSGVA